MKILWVTAQVLPLLSNDLNIKSYNTGGWVMSMLNLLKKIPEFKIGIAMVSSGVKDMFHKTLDGFECYVAPEHGKKGITNKNRDTIINKFDPDIIHIEGNEFPIHNSFTTTPRKTLLSIQGILSGIEPYQNGCIPLNDLMFTFNRNFIPSWFLHLKKKLSFNPRIKIENQTIKASKFITGRTEWDKAHTYWLNPAAKYFKINRILRPIFYKSQWDMDAIDRNTIFVGNGYSPLKGLHFVIEAAAKLKKEFPDIKFKIAGVNPLSHNSFFSLKKYGYGNYIKNLIRKYQVDKNLIFLGSLPAEEMVRQMRSSNIYLLPSLIENSPNTLAEAMMLGMPCISAYTGGAPYMADSEKEAVFYRPNDPDLLAWQIRRLLKTPSFAMEIGKNARERALRTHNIEETLQSLIQVYKYIYIH